MLPDSRSPAIDFQPQDQRDQRHDEFRDLTDEDDQHVGRRSCAAISSPKYESAPVTTTKSAKKNALRPQNSHERTAS